MASYKKIKREEEMIKLARERNSLLAEISESLKTIASWGTSKKTSDQALKDAQQYVKDTGKSAFTV